MNITPRIQQFLDHCNMGDEIVLSDHGSVTQRTGLILGMGSTGLYLIDSGIMTPLATHDAAVAAAAAEEWAANTGATLWEGITS